MPQPHAIRLLGPWTCRTDEETATFRVPGPPPHAGFVALARRFQWIADLPAGAELRLVAPPLPVAACWLLNGVSLGEVPAGSPANWRLPTPLPRHNEVTLALWAWPAAAAFPGAALAVVEPLG